MRWRRLHELKNKLFRLRKRLSWSAEKGRDRNFLSFKTRRISISVFIILSIASICFSQEIALTFDDAPIRDGAYFSGIARTKTLIEKLKKTGVPQAALREKKKIDYGKLRQIYLDHLWKSVAFYDQMARQVIGRSPKHVLLLHENDLAALYVDDLAQLLRDKGWKIISPVEAYDDPIAANAPDVLLNNQGRIAAIAKADGYAGPFGQESEDEEFLEKLFRTSGVIRENK